MLQGLKVLPLCRAGDSSDPDPDRGRAPGTERSGSRAEEGPARVQAGAANRGAPTAGRSSPIHGGQKVKATRVVEEGINKMRSTHNQIRFGLKKGRNSDTCYNVDEP